MMLLTGVTLRRMDPQDPTSTGPSLPNPSRCAAMAASATASLGATIATNPRPSIRDVLAARPPRRRTNDAPPAVLQSALTAANTTTLQQGVEVSSAVAVQTTAPRAATANTVSALKIARAARAAGLQLAVQRNAHTEDSDATFKVEDAGLVPRALKAEEPVQQQVPNRGLLSRILQREDKSGVDGRAQLPQQQQHDDNEDAVTGGAAAMLTTMGLTTEPASVEARYDLWKVCVGVCGRGCVPWSDWQEYFSRVGVSVAGGTHCSQQVRPLVTPTAGCSTGPRGL